MVPTHTEVIEHFRLIAESVDIGIFAYNTPWAMPRPGYDFREPVFDAFVEMPNVVGVMWSCDGRAIVGEHALGPDALVAEPAQGPDRENAAVSPRPWGSTSA
jgi:hypothetical protein